MRFERLKSKDACVGNGDNASHCSCSGNKDGEQTRLQHLGLDSLEGPYGGDAPVWDESKIGFTPDKNGTLYQGWYPQPSGLQQSWCFDDYTKFLEKLWEIHRLYEESIENHGEEAHFADKAGDSYLAFIWLFKSQIFWLVINPYSAMSLKDALW